MPGPNDHHIVIVKGENGEDIVTTAPGLGKDEPKERPRRVDPAVLAALAKQGEELDERRAEVDADRAEVDAAREAVAQERAELERIRAELRADLAKASPAAE